MPRLPSASGTGNTLTDRINQRMDAKSKDTKLLLKLTVCTPAEILDPAIVGSAPIDALVCFCLSVTEWL